MPLKQRFEVSVDALSPEERNFLQQAEKKFRANTNWFAFEDWAFGMRSPLFSRKRSHRDVLRHPLYLALTEMWLDLGEQQGLVGPSKSEEKDLARRKTKRSRASAQERNGAKKRDVETPDSPADRRVSKSRR